MRFISRSLLIKFYLWFLLTLTLTLAGTAVIVFSLFERENDQSFERHVLAEVRVARDIAQTLLEQGIDYAELERVLMPLAEEAHTSVVLLPARSGATPLMRVQPGNALRGNWLPNAEQLDQVQVRGHYIDFHGRGSRIIGMGIRLPGDEAGVLFLIREPRPWRGWRFHIVLLTALGVFLLLAWLLSWKLARHLVKPLQKMAGTAEAFGKGDLSARIGITRADEIGRLADSFDRMAHNVEALVLGHKQLLADISHELRTPLARLQVALELARQDAGASAAPYVETAQRQIGIIDGMIEELLSYSRLEAAPYQLRRELIEPRALLAEVVGNYAHEAEARQVTVSIDSSRSGPEFQGDRLLLQRALGNVVRNAIAYSPAGGAVRITSFRDGNSFGFEIADEGPGLAVEQLERIFQPFYRADSARTRATGGVGLGLAIARRCMEAHGGGISAALPGEGQGLTVRLWLPAG